MDEDIIETYFTIPYKLSPRGVNALMSMIYKLDRTKSLYFTSETATITLSCLIKDINAIRLAIGHAVTFFAAQFTNKDDDTSTRDESTSMFSYGVMPSEEFQSDHGFFIEKNADGAQLPLTPVQEDLLRKWRPLGDREPGSLKGDSGEIKGFEGVWDEIVEEGNIAWEWSLCDVLRQYGSVEETLAVIAEKTGTKLVVDGASQVIRIWSETKKGISAATEILSALNSVKYPAPSTYTPNLIKPQGPCSIEQVFRLTVRFLTYNKFASHTFINPGSWAADSAYRQMARSARFYMMVAEEKKGFVWKVIKFPVIAPLPTAGIPIRTYKVHGSDNGDKDRLMDETKGLQVAIWKEVVNSGTLEKEQIKPPKIPRHRHSFQELEQKKKNAVNFFHTHRPNILDPPALQMESEIHVPRVPRPRPHIISRRLYMSMESHSSFDIAWREHVANALDRTRSIPGNVSLTLTFGRLLIRPFVSPDLEYSENDLLVQLREMAQMMPDTWAAGAIGFQDPAVIAMNRRDMTETPCVGWTQILTKEASEVQQFEALIKEQGWTWLDCKTFVEFSCRDYTGRNFIVSWRVDTADKTDIHVRPAPAEAQVGRVNMHWPTNWYDIRTTITAYDEKYFRCRYREFINFLRSQITVRNMNTTPTSIGVKYPFLPSSEPVEIMDVLLVAYHTYGDTPRENVLTMKSCHTFTTKRSTDERYVVGKTASQAILAESGLPTRWWELSVESKSIQKILKENRSLSLGKIAKLYSSHESLMGEKGKAKALRDIAIRLGPLLGCLGKSDNGVIAHASEVAKLDPEVYKKVPPLVRKTLGEGAFKKATTPSVGQTPTASNTMVGMGRGAGRGTGGSIRGSGRSI